MKELSLIRKSLMPAKDGMFLLAVQNSLPFGWVISCESFVDGRPSLWIGTNPRLGYFAGSSLFAQSAVAVVTRIWATAAQDDPKAFYHWPQSSKRLLLGSLSQRQPHS